MENKLLYFHFYIGNKEVKLAVAERDGKVVDQTVSPLNFEDNLFSALNVLHRLMTAGGGRSGYHPDREFIRKVGRIQASLLNLGAADPAAPLLALFEKHWVPLAKDPQAAACFTFDFAQQPPYTELAELPWEFLSYQDVDLAVGNSPACDFVRSLPAPGAVPAPAAVRQGEPLRILLIISEPEPEVLRQSGKPLVAYRESYVFRLLRVYEELANKQTSQLRLRVLYQPRPNDLQQGQRKAVEFGEFLQWFQKNMVEPDGDPIRNRDNLDFKPHIVHFLGHICTDDRDEEQVGCISDGNELSFAPYQNLTGSVQNDPPCLMILQTPEGIQLHRGRFTQSGTLADLAQKKLPYILSFQHPVSEQGSLAFLRELYARLFAGQSVPNAVTAGRAKLVRDLGSFTDANAFGSPTLYSTLALPGPLHYPLRSDAPAAEPAPGEPGSVAADMTLANRIDAYGKQITRLVESSDLETALRQFKEVTEIAFRSPECDAAVAERYRGYASSLLQDYNYVENAFRTGDIGEPERYQRRKSLGFRLQEYFNPNEFPSVTQKAASTPAPTTNPPRLR